MENEKLNQEIINEKDSVITDEQLLHALQTAKCLTENVVKNLWCITLNKTYEELFGTDLPNDIGSIIIEPKKDMDIPTYILKLGLVDSSYRINMIQFKKIPMVYNEMEILMSSVDLYWNYCKTTYNLPDLVLWKSVWGSFYVAGSPYNSKHISILTSIKNV
jgi:hypothetical protein